MCLLLVLGIAGPVSAQDELPEFRIGFLEGGEYPQFDALRAAYRTQIIGLAKGQFKVIFPARGFRTAGWKRDSCKVFAEQLSRLEGLDLIVAMGPWAVHDLLEAGCQKPIVAAHQYDPVGSGLLTEAGRPIAENLTLTFDPFKMERDISHIMELLSVKRLGVLHFPSGGPVDSTVGRIRAIVNRLGGEVVEAEGWDNYGTYAFFKAYRKLATEVDAIYLTPTLGLTTNKTSPFFEMALRDKMPMCSSEGRFHVTRGGMIAFGSDNLLAEAFYNAHQTLKIMRGATPADLSIAYQQPAVISINQGSMATCGIELPKNFTVLADMFGEVKTPDAIHLDLATALSHGLAASPTLRSVQSKIEMIEAESAKHRAGLLPQIAVNGKLGWQGDNFVDNSYGEAKSNFRSIGIGLSQQLIDLSQWAGQKEATDRALVGQAEEEIAGALLEEGITLAYYEILRLAEVYSQLGEVRQRIDLFAELAQAKEQSGVITATQRIRWQCERLRVTQEMVEVETEQRIARASFSILVGQASSAEIILDPDVASQVRLINEYKLSRPYVETRSKTSRTMRILERLALGNNPSILKKKARVGLIEQKAHAAKRSLFPSVRFSADIAWRDSLADLSDGFSEKTPVWSTGLSFDWPLFSGGAGQSMRRYASRWFDQVGFEADAEQMVLLRQVNQAALTWFARLEKLPLAEESVSQTTFYLNEMTQSYIAGEVPLLEIKDGLDIWIEAKLNNTGERYGYFRGSAKLLRTIGRSLRETGLTPGEAILEALSQ